MIENKQRKCNKKWEDFHIGLKVLMIIGGIIAGAGLLILVGFIVMWLWNALLPKLFGLPAIGYWEAWGILVLARILFGRIGGGSHAAEHGRKRKLRERIRDMEECNEDEKAADTNKPATK